MSLTLNSFWYLNDTIHDQIQIKKEQVNFSEICTFLLREFDLVSMTQFSPDRQTWDYLPSYESSNYLRIDSIIKHRINDNALLSSEIHGIQSQRLSGSFEEITRIYFILHKSALKEREDFTIIVTIYTKWKTFLQLHWRSFVKSITNTYLIHQCQFNISSL